MIPILYDRLETRFTTNGIGRLSECTRCIVTEERNGIYECEFDIPITGEHYSEIIPNKTTILATHDDTHDMQPFDVYRKSAPNIKGIVTFYAHHISYRLNDVVVMPFTAGSIVEAMNSISTYSVGINPFTFWTDKTTSGEYTNNVPVNARGLLGGQENSLLDVYGKGDYEFDRFTVKLHADRGTDSGVEIRYGKNLTDLSYDNDYSSVANAVVPYWSNTEGGIVTLPEMVIVREGIDPIIVPLTDHNDIILRTETNEPIEASTTIIDVVPLDLTDAFSEEPSVEELRSAAISRFSASGMWEPDETINVNFVQLWQTEEYKDYAPLQRVRLCDTVTVIYNALGVRAIKKKVVKTTYNVLLDRYDSVELGTPTVSFAESVRSGLLEEVPTNSMMEAAIQYATEMIRGGLGGYVVMTPGPNGYPQEILIMDTPDVDTAVNVWRFNQGGLGHSHSGYQGPFDDIALTQDGKINASMITTGALSANLITAGTMSADRISGGTFSLGGNGNGRGILNIYDSNGVKQGTIDNNGASVYEYKILRNSEEWGCWRFLAFRVGKSEGSNTVISNTFGPAITFEHYDKSGSLIHLGRIGSVDGTQETGNFKIIGYPGVDINTKSSTGTGWESTTRIRLSSSTGSDGEYIRLIGKTVVAGALMVTGTKPRLVETPNYGKRLNYCYETPTPLFGDIGEAQLDSDGICYVDIDDIFSETIELRQEYQVFLQKEGEGDCWIAEKQKRYFVIKGTPNLKVAWELKAKQRDYDMIRLEQPDSGLDEYEHTTDADSLLDSFINEQEELLYG